MEQITDTRLYNYRVRVIYDSRRAFIECLRKSDNTTHCISPLPRQNYT